MSTNRNRMIGGFKDAFEQGQSRARQSAINSANGFAQSTKQQLIGDSTQEPVESRGTNESGSAEQNSHQPQMTDEQRVEFLRGLYGNNENNKVSEGDGKKPQKGTGDISQALGLPQKDPYEGKTPEEIAQIRVVEKKLHGAYHQTLINPKPREESVAQKLEREEEEKKMSELEEERKKPSPINTQAVKQGTGERILSTLG